MFDKIYLHKDIKMSIFWSLNYHAHFSLFPVIRDLGITVAGISHTEYRLK